MTKAEFGIQVKYCGHEAVFTADVFHMDATVVVRAPGRVEHHLRRDRRSIKEAQFHVSDYPDPGFWRPDLGVLVVPTAQFKKIK